MSVLLISLPEHSRLILQAVAAVRSEVSSYVDAIRSGRMYANGNNRPITPNANTNPDIDTSTGANTSAVEAVSSALPTSGSSSIRMRNNNTHALSILPRIGDNSHNHNHTYEHVGVDEEE
ncbi:hypothetical protein BU17DRAFT_63884 [Hysterangium stoloniferum]|nr:hypothetical protein BU17DRAFT_63884 [Hysterangium stoloniferum]